MTGLFILYTLYYFLLSKSVQHCQNNTKKTVKIDKNVCRKSWKSKKIGQKKILLHCVSFDKLYLNLSVFLVFVKDNSQFPIVEKIVEKKQQVVKTFSKKICIYYRYITQFNSVCKF